MQDDWPPGSTSLQYHGLTGRHIGVNWPPVSWYQVSQVSGFSLAMKIMFITSEIQDGRRCQIVIASVDQIAIVWIKLCHKVWCGCKQLSKGWNKVEDLDNTRNYNKYKHLNSDL